MKQRLLSTNTNSYFWLNKLGGLTPPPPPSYGYAMGAGPIDILYTLDGAFLSKIEAKNIPAVSRIWIDGGHIGVSHSHINT